MCSMPYSPPASKELVTGSCLATECQKLGSLGWEAAPTLSISEGQEEGTGTIQITYTGFGVTSVRGWCCNFHCPYRDRGSLGTTTCWQQRCWRPDLGKYPVSSSICVSTLCRTLTRIQASACQTVTNTCGQVATLPPRMDRDVHWEDI
jgi:hypothetical protein